MMRTTLGPDDLDRLSATLRQANADFEAAYPGDSGSRQPVHTVYGGAHLFKRDTAAKLGDLAVRFLDQHTATPERLAATLGIQGPDGTDLADTVHFRVREKLVREAVEDFRIDFEDGYGPRPDAEEDAEAVRVGGVAAQ